MSLQLVTDHAERAVLRLRQMNGPRFEAMVVALGNQCQALENAIFAMGPARYLANATGATLDAVGTARGIARNGLADDAYRSLIIGGIAAQNSEGRREDVITAVLGLFDAATVFIRSPNSVDAVSAPAAVETVGIGTPQIPASVYPYAINLLSTALGAGIVLDQLFTFDESGTFAMAGPQPWVRGFGAGGFAADVYQNPTS
jgi:hypothetical protein